MTIEFFAAMIPPTVTHQEKAVKVIGGKPVFYEPAELKEARAKLEAYLAKYAPKEKLEGALMLTVKWCFPCGKYADGEYRITKPDTDNLQKLLKDVMTHLGYWRDDAQVVQENVGKHWAKIPGIYIKIDEIQEG
jgi:Holliday junction resolvase RusA-like endonuclease